MPTAADMDRADAAADRAYEQARGEIDAGSRCPKCGYTQNALGAYACTRCGHRWAFEAAPAPFNLAANIEALAISLNRINAREKI